ncbi:hypothetical protein [Pseudochelatococcus contaminans]|uniref:Uncharacterized protein n=1 Tax=Pseudochelatococcus contaminans TaxID=1538103 RepID=A0A7W5Z246_9HYPH|nr:hypothetical protein [Pseudochelatococcus contaminans]MBB3808573.1 hypothetical protein [Pseudochelatococcus contaminans]
MVASRGQPLPSRAWSLPRVASGVRALVLSALVLAIVVGLTGVQIG